MLVRAATTADLPHVAAIYDELVATSVATFDLEPRPLAVWEGRLASTEVGDHFLVAVDDDQVVGFAGSTPYRAKPAYARTREMTVHLGSGARGQGVGSALYDALLPAMRADGVHLAISVIALPNAASEALHSKYGFTRVGVLPEVGWKQDRWIDTAFYTVLLTASS